MSDESQPVNPAELIEQLAGLPDRLDKAVAALGVHEAEPNTEGWSARELAGHLCDASRVWGARARLIALEDRPFLPGYDQEGYVRLNGYRYVPAADQARIYRASNESFLRFLRGLDANAWSREGVHEENGPMTQLQVVTIMAEHESGHVAQIEQFAAAQ